MAWRQIIADCVREGAEKAGTSKRDWIINAAHAYCGGAYKDRTHYLFKFIPGAAVEGDKEYVPTAKPWDTDAPKQVMEQLLLSLLWYFGQQNGPTVIILALTRGTSSIGQAESWSLGSKAGALIGGNIVIVINTRPFLSSDRESKTGEIAPLIALAESTNSLLELDNFDLKKTLVLAAEILSSRDTQLQCGAITAEDADPYRISAEDIPPSLATLIYDVASGNPKQIMEVLDPLLNGYPKASAYHNYGDEKVFSSDWSLPSLAIKGHHILEINSAVKDHLSTHWPWPAKIVSYTEQHYQGLSDHAQVVLHVSSTFQYGVTSELLRPFMEFKPDDVLHFLVAAGFLLHKRVTTLSQDEGFEVAAVKRIRQLDCNAEYVYVCPCVRARARARACACVCCVCVRLLRCVCVRCAGSKRHLPASV